MALWKQTLFHPNGSSRNTEARFHRSTALINLFIHGIPTVLIGSGLFENKGLSIALVKC